MSIYILKKSDYEITAIYYSLGNICIKKIEKGMWGKEEIVASGVKPEFSVFEYNYNYMVIYQKKNGSMYLCENGKEEVKILKVWEMKRMTLLLMRKSGTIRWS